MIPPIPQWSTSKRAGKLPPRLDALLVAAAAAGEDNRALDYTGHPENHLRGFADPSQRCLRIHSVGTAHAAARRGLVQFVGSIDEGNLQLHITGLGLNALAKIRRTP